jgi:hypothetical protein
MSESPIDNPGSVDSANEALALRAQMQILLSRINELEQRSPTPVSSPAPVDRQTQRRQSSLLCSRTLAAELNQPRLVSNPTGATNDTSNSNKISLLAQEVVVADEQKVHTLSVPAVIWAWRLMIESNATRLQQVKIQHFFHRNVMMEIWNRETQNDTEFAMIGSFEALFALEHEAFMRIIARILRPESYRQYIKIMQSCIRKIRTPEDFTLASDKYDTIMYGQVSNLFETVRDVDALLRYYATPEELKRLPLLELGSEKENTGLGVFGIAIALMGRFAEDFKRQLGTKDIRECGDFEAFLKLVTKKNRALANEAKHARCHKASLEGKPSFKEIAEETAYMQSSKKVTESFHSDPPVENLQLAARPRRWDSP